MNIVQEKEINVLKEVIKVLDRNGLHYCAGGGTCLGAVRHKGFIPWDDDIDIVMPRKEYEYFRTELYKQLPPPYKKMDGDVSETHNFVFMKVHDSSTTLIENYAKESPDRITGAFVDIFPVDGVPDGKWQRKIWSVRYRILFTLNNMRRRKYKKIDSPKRLVIETASRILKTFFRYNYFSDALTKFSSKYDMERCAGINANGFPVKKILNYIFDHTLFSDTIPCDFEDIQIMIPRDYDSFLRHLYKDYMQLPKESERGDWHHVYISDMNKPCSYYAKKIEQELSQKNKRSKC